MRWLKMLHQRKRCHLELQVLRRDEMKGNGQFPRYLQVRDGMIKLLSYTFSTFHEKGRLIQMDGPKPRAWSLEPRGGVKKHRG